MRLLILLLSILLFSCKENPKKEIETQDETSETFTLEEETSTIKIADRTDEYGILAMEYFKNNGTEKQYSEAYDNMFVMFKNQYASKNVPDAVWKELQESKDEEVKTIKTLLIQAYQANFSLEDLQLMNNFYKTNAAQLQMTDRTKLTETHKTELANFFNSEIGKKMNDKQPSLAALISKISVNWSSDLYHKVKNKLTELGYGILEVED